MDICGELEFMETMKVKYHEKAVETGPLVVSTVLGVPNVVKLRRGCQDPKEQDILQKKRRYLVVLSLHTFHGIVSFHERSGVH